MNNKPVQWAVIRGGLALVTLIVVIFLALSVGRYHISVNIVGDILWQALAQHADPAARLAENRTAGNVVLNVRLPRVLIAGVAGAGLSVAGAALQGLFRNPLVGPQMIGVSSGAAFGGVLAILLFSSMALTIVFAFFGGALAIALVFLLVYRRQEQGLLMLILAGVVINAFFAALISLVSYVADPNSTLPGIVFWLMGSFASATWTKLWVLLPPVVFGCALIMACRFRINALSLGEEQARALGGSLGAMRWIILASVTLITSATVAISGTIGWVGLIIPHVARLLSGPDHRTLIPASAVTGAIYMIAVDTLARSAISAEIPLSIITALVGAPIFALLLQTSLSRRNAP